VSPCLPHAAGVAASATLSAALRALALCVPLATTPSAHAQCDARLQCCVTPRPGGTPECGSSGPTQQAATGPGTTAGNPLDIISGNKYQRETDLPALPGILGLELVRHYNSTHGHRARHLGRGWRLSYDAELQAGSESLSIVQADGTTVRFARGYAQPDVFHAADPQRGTVRRVRSSSGLHFLWTWPDGRELRFEQGRLAQITAPTGEFVSFVRSPDGLLMNVRDPQGRTLYLIYDRQQRVTAIETPVGRFTYAYGGKPANLLKVGQPRGITRTYHYEDARHPQALTGITVSGAGSDGRAMNERLATWGYDDRGHAVASVRGDGRDGIERVAVQRRMIDKGGEATLTNSLGQTTMYRWRTIAGQSRLLEAMGPGCSTCSPSNVRYGYETKGRLTEITQLDAQGKPSHTIVNTLDPLGRMLSTVSTAYVGGKAQPPEWQIRYGYASAEAASPSLIARKSVIPGREHTLRIERNEYGQPTRITEHGYSPLDEHGQPSLAGTPIRRVTTYAYTVVNRRSLLTRVDGPLPNGPTASPADSDITDMRYDEDGNHVLSLTTPLGFVATLRHDAAGRLAEVTGTGGTTEAFVYGATGTLESKLQHRGNRLLGGTVQKHDALGRVTETLSSIDGKLVPSAAQGYDVAGRLKWQADALGIARQAGYDSEGRLLQSTVQTASFRQRERYRHDASGRLERVDDDTGAVRQITYDTAGRLAGMVDPLGRLTRYAHDESGFVRQVTHGANSMQPLIVDYGRDAHGAVSEVSALASDGAASPRRVTTRLLKDDFGREVAAVSPDSGRTLRWHDEADRLLRLQGPDGSATHFEYDVAGRLVRTTARGPIGSAEPATSYLYDGPRLVEVRHPSQTERYTYDPDGHVASRRVTLTLTNGAPVEHLTRYRYDPAGHLTEQTLPDGSRLQYERNGQGQVVALHRRTGWLPFGWATSTLISELQRDMVGLRSATYGNGVKGQWQRSRDGVLARVIYTGARRQASAAQNALGGWLPTAHAQAVTAPASSASAPGAFGLPTTAQALWDSRLLYDAAGNVVAQRQFADSAVTPPSVTTYAYDAHDQLLQASRIDGVPHPEPAAAATVWRYHHDSLGNRLLAQQAQPAPEMAQTQKLGYATDSNRLQSPMDGTGRPNADSVRRYEWDAQGRLTAIHKDGDVTARYRYNHRAERVSKQVGGKTQHYLYDERRQRLAELDEHGRLTRQYVWLAGQLIAVIDMPRPQALREPVDGLAAQAWQAIAFAWDVLWGNAPSAAWVHLNHLGAPVAMTDAKGKPVWAAEHAPFGRSVRAGHVPREKAASMRLDLRLPGQWQDEESGLHYNDHRYFDPDAGRYLSPDPIGMQGGLNAYSYVGNNPIGFSDPLGLILFAFDATNNATPSHGPEDVSNVFKFFRGYDDQQNGRKWYMTGVGRDDPDSRIRTNLTDAADANTARDRVNYMLGELDRHMRNNTFQQDQVVSIDIVGFSRGAAMARDFANRVAERIRNDAFAKSGACAELRFLGLWDTVAQFGPFGLSNHHWQLAIPPEARNVFHAVAVNEHRALMPVEAIGRGTQRGFVGDHKDVGGGFATGDLSDVALNWIVQNAKESGIRMIRWGQRETDIEWGHVANPVIHDKSNDTEDRDVCLRVNNEAWADNCIGQRVANPGGLSTQESRQFISRWMQSAVDGDGNSRIIGKVNMDEYAKWLKYNYDLEVQHR
jgi:RHS repeat-associated protein